MELFHIVFIILGVFGVLGVILCSIAYLPNSPYGTLTSNEKAGVGVGLTVSILLVVFSVVYFLKPRSYAEPQRKQSDLIQDSLLSRKKGAPLPPMIRRQTRNRRPIMEELKEGIVITFNKKGEREEVDFEDYTMV